MLVYPVIHHRDDDLTIDQTFMAHEAGADGVFLISHYQQNKEISKLVPYLKNNNDRTFKIGLNLLGESNLSAFYGANDVYADMLWLDSPGINSAGIDHFMYKFEHLRKNFAPKMEVFSSVAFKYQPIELYPKKAVELCHVMGYTPTTSGPATGEPPTVDKIKNMHIPDRSLGIASGLSLDNILDFKPYITHALVSSSVSKNEFEFDFEILSAFVAKAKNG